VRKDGLLLKTNEGNQEGKGHEKDNEEIIDINFSFKKAFSPKAGRLFFLRLKVKGLRLNVEL
jgi:hypothetical protein